AWLGELSPADGGLLWAHTRDEGDSDTARALSVDDQGDIELTYEIEPDQWGYTTLFHDDGSKPLVSLMHLFGVHDQARRPDGGLALVGTRAGRGYGSDLVVESLDAGFIEQWEQ